MQDDIGHGLISTRSHWKNLDDEDVEFPELDLDILRSLFFGIYQIKQSKTYTEEHLYENGNYVIQVASENNEVLRCFIHSRHSNATRHYAWIQYNLASNRIDVNADQMLERWNIVDILRVLSGTYRMHAYMSFNHHPIENKLSRPLSIFEIIEMNNKKKKKEK